MTRKHFTQLAGSGELDQMLSLEAKRPFTSKEFYPDFSTARQWLETLNINSSFFDLKDRHEIAAEANNLKNEVVQSTLDGISDEDKRLKEKLINVSDYLGEEDKPTKSDIIFVFGSGDEGRIEKAYELWKENVSKKIVVAGGKPYYQADKLPEAIEFSRYALDLGVPKECLLVEPNSLNIRDNIKSALNLMDLYEIPYTRNGITTVTAWFAHRRRVWCNFSRWVPENTPLYRVNTIIATGRLAQDRWFDNELGIKVIFNEFVKMAISFNTPNQK